MRAVLVGIVATTALASCTPTSTDSPLDVRRAQVDSLEPTLPALAALEVELFRDQDWCAVLDYARGTFTTNERETCVYFADDPQPFDAQASADFDALKASLQASGVPVRLISDVVVAEGRLTEVTFELEDGDLNYKRLIYNETGDAPPEDPERTDSRLNKTWFYQVEDWM